MSRGKWLVWVPGLLSLFVTVRAGPWDDPVRVLHHRSGRDCGVCHDTTFSLAGTVYNDYQGSMEMAGVQAALIDSLGAQPWTGVTDSVGNFWRYLPELPGKYLPRAGSIRARSWHALPGLKSCNACHIVGGNSERMFPADHTFINTENDCSGCHHYPRAESYALLSTPGRLNGTPVTPPVVRDRVIIGSNTFYFAPDSVTITTARPDIFAPGYYSLYDVLLSTSQKYGFALASHYDTTLFTHVIDAINGNPGPWWFHGIYQGGGTSENNNQRMDTWLYKPHSTVTMYAVSTVLRDSIIREFRDEITTWKYYRSIYPDGRTYIPRVTFRVHPSDYHGNPPESDRDAWDRTFSDVMVLPHHVRTTGRAPWGIIPAPFQPGVITSLDVLLSLRDQGLLNRVEFAWFEKINHNFLQDFYVQAVGADTFYTHASGSQGFTYTTGYNADNQQPNQRILHVHPDIHQIYVTDFEAWQWTELGPPYYGDDSLPSGAGQQDDHPPSPWATALLLNAPNPFREGTVIRFSLPRAGRIRLAVHNLLGQEVCELASGFRVSGAYEVPWDGRDALGREVPAGIYFYRLTMSQGVVTRKLMVLR